MKLNILAFGLASGVMWAAHFVLVTIFNIAFGRAQAWVDVLIDLYPGYTPTTSGMMVGAGLGFLDAVVFCTILAWLYNMFVSKCVVCSMVAGTDGGQSCGVPPAQGDDR